MVQIGKYDSYYIYIYGNEGPKPYFHIFTGNPSYPEWQSCICIASPEYFHHSGKEGMLNASQIKKMVSFLGMKNEDMPDKTNWEIVVFQWNQNNPQWKININAPMPDYNLL